MSISRDSHVVGTDRTYLDFVAAGVISWKLILPPPTIFTAVIAQR